MDGTRPGWWTPLRSTARLLLSPLRWSSGASPRRSDPVVRPGHLPIHRVLLAALRAGAVLVPLNPSATVAEVDHVVADATPVLALCDRERPDAFRAGPLVLSIDELSAGQGFGGMVPCR